MSTSSDRSNAPARTGAPVRGTEDDLVHAPAADPRWRESYYFSFYDPAHDIGVWHSIGKRPAKGYSGFSMGVWGQRVLAAAEADRFSEHTNEHRVAGLEYACLEPMGTWRTRLDGRLADASAGGPRVDRRALASARDDDAAVPVRFDLTFSPVQPPCVYLPDERWLPLFTGHIDQVGRVGGWMEIGSERFEIEAWGGKDHSWGTRDWFAPEGWRFLDLQVPDGPKVMMWAASIVGDTVIDGAVYRDGSMFRAVSYEERVESELDGEKSLPRRFAASIVDDGDATTGLTGEVLRIFPVLFESKDGRRVSWNDRAMVRFITENGLVGHGNVEFAEILDGGAHAPLVFAAKGGS